MQNIAEEKAKQSCGHEGANNDIVDLAYLYKVLCSEILPTYYDGREKWIEMMKNSIEMSPWNFSAARMLKQYYEQMYQK